MNQKLFFIFLLLIYICKINAQVGIVGINTETPKAALDINGDLIIGTATPMHTNDNDVLNLVRNNTTGLVGVIPQLKLTTSSVNSGDSVSINIESLHYPSTGYIIVTTTNACVKHMTSIFNVVVSDPSEYGLPIVYLNSTARDIIGVATQNGPYQYQVKFPGTAGCADGGNATQFDFTIDTSIPGKINITNNGNRTRIYRVYVSLIY